MTGQPPAGSHFDEWRAERRRSRGARRAFIGAVLVIVGAAFLLQSLGVWTVRGDVVWPVIVIALGAWFVFGAVTPRAHRRR